MEGNTTNDVLLEKMENMKEQNSIDHSEIKDRLDHTNGNVTELQKWRYFIIGAISLLSAIVVPMALMVFSKFLDNI